MRWIERQSKVEDAVYECIDEIAEELRLDVPFYPEVYWAGDKLNFNSLGLSKNILDLLNWHKQERVFICQNRKLY